MFIYSRQERNDHNASYVGCYGDVESDPQPMNEVESEGPSGETTDEGRGSLDRRSPLAGPKKGCGGKWRKEKPKSLAHSPRPVQEIENKLMVKYYKYYFRIVRIINFKIAGDQLLIII